MRILVSCIPYDGGKSGISVYTREVVRELARQGHRLALVVEPGVDPAEIHGGAEPAPETIRAPRWTRRPALSMLWHLLALPFAIRRRRRDFDGFLICAANRRVCAFHPLPTAATVHDLANFRIKAKYSRLRMFYLAHVLPRFAKKAYRLVAVSGATKDDMVRFWCCPPEQVAVLYNGVDAPPPGSAAGSAGSALLYISRIEHPGKNHVRLIEAYGRLPRALAEKHPLVIAGSDWKDAETVHEAARRSPFADLITFTGFAGGEALEKLWSETGFYVFPSLFEGFGLSLVEAMARGIPCACSNNGSLGEIAGDAAITFDPESVDGIADALERLLSLDGAGLSALAARGKERAKMFSWKDHAAGIAKLLEDAK